MSAVPAISGLRLTAGSTTFSSAFGGYSLAIDDTVFAMVAEGDIYLKACEQSAAYRVEHRNPLLTLRRHGRIVPLKYYQIDDIVAR
jgi:DNA transformation protein